METFDWTRDIGPITEHQAAEQAKDAGETFEQWAQGVVDHYPEMFGKKAPDGLKEWIVEQLEKYA